MEKTYSLNEWHRKQAIHSFNSTWDLMDKKERTREDDMAMIHTAHASRFHWSVIGKELEAARGEWQISRVYSILKHSESAKFHAEHSLALCLENAIGDFDLAFAYEALSRACAISGQKEEAKKYYDDALKASESIRESEDKNYFLSELSTILLDT